MPAAAARSNVAYMISSRALLRASKCARRQRVYLEAIGVLLTSALRQKRSVKNVRSVRSGRICRYNISNPSMFGPFAFGKPRDFWTPVSSEEITDKALSWLTTVAAKAPVVYTNRARRKERIKDEIK